MTAQLLIFICLMIFASKFVILIPTNNVGKLSYSESSHERLVSSHYRFHRHFRIVHINCQLLEKSEDCCELQMGPGLFVRVLLYVEA